MASGSTQACGLTILRIVVGIVFLVHGYQKLFHMGFHGVAGFFSHAGIPLPLVSAVVVTLVEFVGGIALIAGIGVRIAGALLAVDMLVAILVVHIKHGFFNPMGFEFPLTLLAATLCLALSGGGMFSLKK
ncbi:MAG TPA: DoxX family protein [Terriglobales bacterium]|nr:DoxX family protein [Terriglobales bacterium]